MTARTQAVAFALFGLTVALWAGPAILTLTGAAEQPSDAPAQPAQAAQEQEASLSPEEQIAKEGVIPALVRLEKTVARLESELRNMSKRLDDFKNDQRAINTRLANDIATRAMQAALDTEVKARREADTKWLDTFKAIHKFASDTREKEFANGWWQYFTRAYLEKNVCNFTIP